MLGVTELGRTIVLEIARTDPERARGLMGRREVPLGTGMIFLFDELGDHPIWMFNCLTSLDLVWLDAERRVIHVETAAPPCAEPPCPSYDAPRPSRYVVEVGGGQAESLGLALGTRLMLTPDPRELR